MLLTFPDFVMFAAFPNTALSRSRCGRSPSETRSFTRLCACGVISTPVRSEMKVSCVTWGLLTCAKCAVIQCRGSHKMHVTTYIRAYHVTDKI